MAKTETNIRIPEMRGMSIFTKTPNDLVYGHLLEMFGGYAIMAHGMENQVTMIDPESIGEYSGFKDINNFKIYEGDICEFVEYGRQITGVVRVRHGAFVLCWNVVVGGHGQKASHDTYMHLVRSLKIIGSAFKQPHLLSERCCI